MIKSQACCFFRHTV